LWANWAFHILNNKIPSEGSSMNPPRKRPGIVMVAALLLLIFGFYGLIQGAFSLANLALGEVLPNPGGQDNMVVFLAKEEPSYPLAEGSSAVVRLLLAVAGIVAGIGAIKLRPGARKLGMAVAVGNLLLVLVYSAYFVIFLLPPTNRFFEQQIKAAVAPQGAPPPEFGAFLKFLVGGAIIFGSLFSMALWLTVFFLLRSQKSRDAFAGTLAAEPPALPEEHIRSPYTGYEDGEPRPPETGITR
jgi:hypothetical protein